MYMWWINSQDRSDKKFKNSADAMNAAKQYAEAHFLDPKTIKIEYVDL